jgi:hypothetical protein
MRLPPNPAEFLRWVQMLACVAVALASLDLLASHRRFRKCGLLAIEQSQRHVLFGLAGAQLVIALLLVPDWMAGWARTAALGILVVLPSLIARRMSFGHDASLQMVRIVLAALLIQSLAPQDPELKRACLWFIALQAVGSYVTAGAAKLAMPQWRSGRYLQQMLASRAYGRLWAARIVDDPSAARWFSRGIIAFECSFLFAPFAGVPGAIAFCAAAAFFHLMNAAVMGLNLFVWSFLATYPAILYCAGDMSRMLFASDTR